MRFGDVLFKKVAIKPRMDVRFMHSNCVASGEGFVYDRGREVCDVIHKF